MLADCCLRCRHVARCYRLIHVRAAGAAGRLDSDRDPGVTPHSTPSSEARSREALALPACRCCPHRAGGAFADLPDAALACLDEDHRVGHYRKGEVVYSEGDPAGSLYCVYTGRVRLYRLTPGGGMRVLRFVGPAHLFGHVELLSGGPRTVTAEAAENAVVCRLPARGILALARSDPAFSLALAQSMALDLRHTEELLLGGASPVRHRVARLLLELGGPDGQEIPMSRLEMAQLVGTTPETLTRVLSELDREGVIRRHRKRLRIVDRFALSGLARLAT